jgi:hypothetical protein
MVPMTTWRGRELGSSSSTIGGFVRSVMPSQGR